MAWCAAVDAFSFSGSPIGELSRKLVRRAASISEPTDIMKGFFEAVSIAKAGRLRRLAARWLEEHDVHAPEIRIDLVGVLLADKGAAEVEHLRGVG